MKRILIGSYALLGACSMAGNAADRPAILAVLNDQAAAWNRGDLDAFLEGYWKSDQTVFAGGDKIHRGFQAMAERYRKSYPSRKEMGRLTFAELAFESQESDRAVVTGTWDLELEGGGRPGGVFTLILKRFPEGWRIVHDHTSSRAK